MEKAAAKPPLPHDLILESRSRLTVTGVQRVLHCSAESAALETGKGILHLSGAQISMQTLDRIRTETVQTGLLLLQRSVRFFRLLLHQKHFLRK